MSNKEIPVYINKRYLKILKEINKGKYIYVKNEENEDLVNRLMEDNIITYQLGKSEHEPYYVNFKLLTKGETIVQGIYSDIRHRRWQAIQYWITTIIAIIALIRTF